MKKITVLLFFLCFCVFSGCSGKVTYLTKSTFERESKFVAIETVEAADDWLQIKISNLTDDVIEVDWLRSSIDDSGVLTNGHKAATAGTSTVPPSIITPKRNVTKVLYKTEGTYFFRGDIFSGWVYGNIKWPAILAIKVKSGDKEEYIILNVNIDKPIKPAEIAEDRNIDPDDRR